MNIVVEHCEAPFFVATISGQFLCRSKTPLLSAARILLKAGANPAEELTMIREDGVVSMRTTVGDAASLTVAEPDSYPPRFRKWVPFDARSTFPRGR